MTSLDDDARKSVQDALDALRQWRKEIDAANERGLTKAMDSMRAAQQALGWPDRITTATGESAVLPGKMHYFMVLDAVREQLLKSSKEDMRVIDKVAEACYASLPPQTSVQPRASASPQAALLGAAPAEASTRSRIPLLVGLLVAMGAIVYAISDQTARHTSTAVNNDKYIDGATTKQKSAEAVVPNETSAPMPSPPQTTDPDQEEKVLAPQAAITPESRDRASAGKLIVELGALSSQERATRKWRELQKRSVNMLAGHASVVAKTKRNGGAVWLLEIHDFSDKSAAVDFCESLHRRGIQCDIRVTP
jgi:hypothetical protein